MNVFARLATVIQDTRIRAAGVFEGVAEDWQAVEGLIPVDRIRQAENGRREPRRVECNGAERKRAEDVPEQGTLSSPCGGVLFVPSIITGILCLLIPCIVWLVFAIGGDLIPLLPSFLSGLFLGSLGLGPGDALPGRVRL